MSNYDDDLYSELNNNVSGISQSAVGAQLKKIREQHNVSLQDVSDYLNIRKTILMAIEQGNHAQLPEPVYSIGFVKSYAQYLNLDATLLVNRFKQEIGQKDIPRVAVQDIETPHPFLTILDKGLPDIKVLGVAAAIFILLVLVISWIFSDDEVEAVINSPQEITDVFNAEQIKAAGIDIDLDFKENVDALTVTQDISVTHNNPTLKESADKGRAYGAEKTNARVYIKAIQNSWTEIKDENGKTLLSRVLKPGDTYQVSKDGKAILTTGNAGGLEIYIDDEFAGVAGKSGEILKKYAVTAEGLVKQ